MYTCRILILYSWVCSVTQLYPTLHDPCQAPLSMEFSRQEYWNALPFPSPEDLPGIPLPGIGPGIEPVSLASPALAGGFFTTAPPGRTYYMP